MYEGRKEGRNPLSMRENRKLFNHSKRERRLSYLFAIKRISSWKGVVIRVISRCCVLLLLLWWCWLPFAVVAAVTAAGVGGGRGAAILLSKLVMPIIGCYSHPPAGPPHRWPNTRPKRTTNGKWGIVTFPPPFSTPAG